MISWFPYTATGENRKDDTMRGKHKGADKVYRSHKLGYELYAESARRSGKAETVGNSYCSVIFISFQ